MNSVLLNRLNLIESLINLLKTRGYEKEKNEALKGELSYTAKTIKRDMHLYNADEQRQAVEALRKVESVGVEIS